MSHEFLLTLAINSLSQRDESDDVWESRFSRRFYFLRNIVGKVDNSVCPVTNQQIKDSIQADYLVCFEDGRQLKSLRRHLMSHYGLTPEEYRRKWGLPSDYPMICPNFSHRRKQIAYEIGLGHQRKELD